MHDAVREKISSRVLCCLSSPGSRLEQTAHGERTAAPTRTLTRTRTHNSLYFLSALRTSTSAGIALSTKGTTMTTSVPERFSSRGGCPLSRTPSCGWSSVRYITIAGLIRAFGRAVQGLRITPSPPGNWHRCQQRLSLYLSPSIDSLLGLPLFCPFSRSFCVTPHTLTPTSTHAHVHPRHPLMRVRTHCSQDKRRRCAVR